MIESSGSSKKCKALVCKDSSNRGASSSGMAESLYQFWWIKYKLTNSKFHKWTNIATLVTQTAIKETIIILLSRSFPSQTWTYKMKPSRNNAHSQLISPKWRKVLWWSSRSSRVGWVRPVSNHQWCKHWALVWEIRWEAYAGSKHLARGRTSTQRIRSAAPTKSCNSKDSQPWCKQRRKLCYRWFSRMK